MIIRHSFIIFTICFGVVFLLTIASANAYEFPPYEGLNLKIEGKISENYSNNVTFAKDKENRIEDFMTMLALGLDMKYEGKRRALGISGRASRRVKTKSTDIQNSSENLTVNFRNEFSEYDAISVNNTFTHTQMPETFEDEFGRIQGRFDSYNNGLSFQYNRIINKYFNVGVNYDNRFYSNSREGTKDLYKNGVRLRVNYIHSAATDFSLSSNFSKSEFEGGDDVSMYLISAGVGHYITKRLQFRAGAGVNVSSRGEDRNTRQDINISLSNQIDENTNASLSYTRGVQLSADTGNLFSNWRITGRLTRQLLEDLNGSLSGFYGQGEYDLTGVTDTLAGASASLSYNFWRGKRGSRVSGSLGYTYSNLDSTDEDRGYDRNSITSGVNIVF